MTSVFLTSGWAFYDHLISPIPHGKLFSWHAVLMPFQILSNGFQLRLV